MTKSELIDKISGHFPHLVQKDAQIVTEVIIESISEALVSGRRVEIRGFGSFNIHDRQPRLGRNPRNGEPVAVPPKHVPRFRAGAPLLDNIQPAQS